nr:MFS transporter [Pseudaestuariivita atlantica]
MTASTAFDALTDADGAADETEARNGLRHVAALGQTKVADGLIDPKLVLSWLMQSLGAPAWLISALVPIREAGALLPQILLAGRLRRMQARRWMWVTGAAGQGIAAALIVLAGVTLSGLAAGFAICAALAMLAMFRAACSVSFKDILGKTIAKTRRGAITGFAASASSVAVLVFAGLLIAGILRSEAAVLAAIALAAILWASAAMVMARVEEEPSTAEADAPALDLSPLREDARLRLFLVVRGLLIATSLAPPYFVLLGSAQGVLALDRLGAMLLASAAGSLLSSYVWGRLADRSSRLVLAMAGGIAAAAMLAAVGLALAGLGGALLAMPLALFVQMVAYHGVRQGRSTYLVDMAPEDRRAAYAAVANTVIGVLLLATGLVAGVGAVFGAEITLILFAAMAAGGGLLALRLEEVEGR